MQFILPVEITAVRPSCEDDGNDDCESKKSPYHF
jgi:hypothetical protein